MGPLILIKPYMLKTISLSILILFLLVSNDAVSAQKRPKPAAAQGNPVVRLTPRRGTAKRDRNIGRPIKRSSTGAKGTTKCDVGLENRTRYSMMVYLNNELRGYVKAGARFVDVIDAGRTKVYTRTDRDISGFLYWGPSYRACGSVMSHGMLELEIGAP